jgi:hypothetical protein
MGGYGAFVLSRFWTCLMAAALGSYEFTSMNLLWESDTADRVSRKARVCKRKADWEQLLRKACWP